MKSFSKSTFAPASLICSLLLIVTACGNPPTSNEKPATGAEPAPETQPSAEWPAEIPAGVPPFTFGQLAETKNGDTNENLTWVIRYRGTSTDHVKAYEAVLQKNGFDPATIPFGDNGNMIVGLKGNLTVTINHKNGLTTIGVNQKK